MRTWWHAVVESEHALQNPTSEEKIRLLGERLGLGPGSHVLDMASGRGGPAIVLAREFGCRLTCVERAPEFVADARQLVAEAGLEDRIEIVEADGATFELGKYDAALCIGATFVYGGLVPTIERLRPAAPMLAVGEPYWRIWPLPPEPELHGSSLRTDEGEWLPLAETVERRSRPGCASSRSSLPPRTIGTVTSRSTGRRSTAGSRRIRIIRRWRSFAPAAPPTVSATCAGSGP